MDCVSTRIEWFREESIPISEIRTGGVFAYNPSATVIYQKTIINGTTYGIPLAIHNGLPVELPGYRKVYPVELTRIEDGVLYARPLRP